MKKTWVFLIALLLYLTSCESDKVGPGTEILFKSGKDFIFRYSDFAFYDSSAYIFYFKTNHPAIQVDRTTSFVVMAGGEEVYQGFFLPGYSSYLPAGPFIFSSPSFYPDYVLKIETMILKNNIDPRNDFRFISTLRENDLLHGGLSVVIDSVVSDGSDLTFAFTITSKDQSDLLIIDPDKTGINLYHYFTNGLMLRDIKDSATVFESTIVHQEPDPWNGWKPEWLSVIRPGESKTFVLNYPLLSPLEPGNYRAHFEFPGMHYQVSKEQLIQDNGRIWLGGVNTVKKILIQ